MKKILMLFVIVAMLLSSTSVLAAEDEIGGSSGDTPSGWAKEDVERAIELGIVPERLQSKYQDPITREEFAELIVETIFAREVKFGFNPIYSWTKEMVLERVTLDFEFVDADQDHVKLAFILGSIDGISDTHFAPDRHITRQEAAVMLVNTSHLLVGITYYSKEDLGYEDFDEIADWARPGVQAAASVGYMHGVGSKFDYNGKLTREQSIVTMLRLYNERDDFALRGNLTVYANNHELRYNIGRDYIKVNYVDDGEHTDLDTFTRRQWYNKPISKEDKKAYSIEKGIALYAFGAQMKPSTFTQIVQPIMNGEKTKWDYGYMVVAPYEDDSIITFYFKPIQGFMSMTNGYKYGYPEFSPVTVTKVEE